MPRKAVIGDIVEIKTPSGLGYVQYTHDHHNMGALVRVLPGLYSGRPKDFNDLAREKELYFTFYSLKYAVPEGQAEVVAHQPIPGWAKPYPMMRHSNEDLTGKVHSWIVIRADLPFTLQNLKNAPKYKELTPEIEKLSIHSLWSHALLVKRLAQGWTPERAEEFRLKEVEEDNAEQWDVSTPKPGSNQSMRHYLYFPQKTDAEKAAQWFRSQGFSVDVLLGADKKNWLALVKHETVENQQDLEKLRQEMEALVESLNGEYDGWEIAI